MQGWAGDAAVPGTMKRGTCGLPIVTGTPLTTGTTTSGSAAPMIQRMAGCGSPRGGRAPEVIRAAQFLANNLFVGRISNSPAFWPRCLKAGRFFAGYPGLERKQEAPRPSCGGWYNSAIPIQSQIYLCPPSSFPPLTCCPFASASRRSLNTTA